MFLDYFSIAVKNLRNRKLRSWLTILGIVISVASIVALFAVSSALKSTIVMQFEKMGSNRLFILPKGGQPGTTEGLTINDLDIVREFSEFDFVFSYLIIYGTEVEFHNKKAYTGIFGLDTKNIDKWVTTFDYKLVKGRIFHEKEKFSAVIGYQVGKELFDKDLDTNMKIKIKGYDFKIVGILEEMGNRQDDTQIYIPLETAREIFSKEKEVTMIDAVVKPGYDLNKISDKLTRKLENRRGNKNFEVYTPEQILSFLQTTLGILQAILISIATISLIVGAVGIMNSMFTSVLERTKEIGIMKSIGATRYNILFLFLIESGLIGIVGGIFGVLLGYVTASIIGGIIKNAGFGLLEIHFSIFLAIFSILFSFFVGMLSGYLPAKRAAKLQPIEALRFIK